MFFNNNNVPERQVRYQPYSEYGIGYKYQITPGIQIELLYTRYFDSTPGRRGDTYNFGLRNIFEC